MTIGNWRGEWEGEGYGIIECNYGILPEPHWTTGEATMMSHLIMLTAKYSDLRTDPRGFSITHDDGTPWHASSWSWPWARATSDKIPSVSSDTSITAWLAGWSSTMTKYDESLVWASLWDLWGLDLRDLTKKNLRLLAASMVALWAKLAWQAATCIKIHNSEHLNSKKRIQRVRNKTYKITS